MNFQKYNVLVLSTVCPALLRFLNAPYCIPSVGCNSPISLVFQTISLLPASSNERRNFQHVSNPHFITVPILLLLRIKSHATFPLLCSYQIFSPGPRFSVWTFSNEIGISELLAPRPTEKMEDHPLSVVRNCLFNIFAATLHIRGRSSIRNLRKNHGVVTGTRLSRNTRGCW